MLLIVDSGMAVVQDVRKAISASKVCPSNTSIHSNHDFARCVVHTLAFVLSSFPCCEYQLEHAVAVLTERLTG